MITTFRGRALDWYMKFSLVSVRTPQNFLDYIRTGLIDEFKKPKYELKCIAELKEIKQLSGESVWDFDQRFKTMMAKVSFHVSDFQHKQWFIVVLLPHIRVPLMQQKIVLR